MGQRIDFRGRCWRVLHDPVPMVTPNIDLEARSYDKAIYP